MDNGTVCLTDFYATFAEMTGYRIADNEAEDSFSFLGRIDKSSKGEKSVRPIVLHSADGSLSLKDGKWKFLRTKYSGGWSSPSPKDGVQHDDLSEYQLYNVKRDPSESRNLYNKKRRLSERMLNTLSGITK
uniref:Sulfatase N-terminal domain-containing protein n=1 Tax=uncultured prokaryote TaxID=198431 RepID=A0A0H5Q3L3_9ZZZZ|nr:hypothetical protein [uncultured prokaryote]